MCVSVWRCGAGTWPRSIVSCWRKRRHADAIRSNPNYHGELVRLISCYSGADARPPELPLAQSVANELGVPVTAPTSKVGTSPQLGLNQTPTIGNNGYWRTYLPMAH